MTLNDIFDLAMILSDNEDDADLYSSRALGILKVLRREIATLSDNRDALPALDSLDSVFGLDDEFSEGVVPYGLAAHLLLEDNPGTASYYAQKYEEGLRYYLSRKKADLEEVERSYGLLEYGAFARW
jgi:hypothetical protein